MLSIFDFQKRFPDEEACFQYLYEQKWPSGFVCPGCYHPDAYFIRTRKLMQCKSCKHQASVTAGTIFHKMRQPLLVLFWACYWLATTKKGISSKELQRKLGLKSYQTAWTLSHKIRNAMKSSGQYPIQNDVEFDEAFLGLPEEDSESSRRALVKAVVETDGNFMGRTYLEHLQSGTVKTIENFLDKFVRPGVVIKTDGHPLYRFIKQRYEHQAYKTYRNKNIENLPKIHMVIANLKMWLAGTFNCMPYKHAQRYLDEFCFRFNRRWKLETIFDKLIIRAVGTSPITYAELTG